MTAPTDKQQEVFATVAAARDASWELVRSRFPPPPVRGVARPRPEPIASDATAQQIARGAELFGVGRFDAAGQAQRGRDELTARPLAGTEGGSGPFFSPDGATIGYVAGRMKWLVIGTPGSDAARVLSNVAFYVFIPALLFRTTARLDPSQMPWASIVA